MTKAPRKLSDDDYDPDFEPGDDAGKGLENLTVTEHAYWLDLEDAEWVDVLEIIDKSMKENGSANTDRLIALLRSDIKITRNARGFLSDLLTRYKLEPIGQKGRPRTPSYNRTLATRRLEAAAAAVRARGKSTSVKEAMNWAAKEHGVTVEALALHRQGRLGSTRRKK